MELLFEWDENKARENLKKHKVSFEEVKTVFNDPLLLTFLDEEHSEGEERYISIGTSATSRILLVVHAEREATEETLIIRVISCRKATASERRTYEEGED
ncbi:MAG: BrnT family toxin [Acidobacteria bacterium]|nr:BrnT family toxin [Acidobacteriota bacterium]